MRQLRFVHAKTLVTNGILSIIGTANMDHRSFELNFEVNAIVYEAAFASQLRKVFFDDLEEAEKLDPEKWYNRSIWTQLPEKFARLLSPSL
ncbi:MAG: phospholipase D-like domain-containing protein [Ferruginibacter sp.]